MKADTVYLPGFRTACLAVGLLYALLGGSMLVRGAVTAMQPFGVPDLVLRSPHFADFFHFTFVHMASSSACSTAWAAGGCRWKVVEFISRRTLTQPGSFSSTTSFCG